MMNFQIRAKEFSDPEKMAAEYLVQYYGGKKIEYPINYTDHRRTEVEVRIISRMRILCLTLSI